jgi:hypothetical protein
MAKRRIELLKERLARSALRESWKTAAGNKKKFLLTIAFDASFLVLLALLNIALNTLFPNPQGMSYGATRNLLTILLVVLAYLSIALFFYTFFKHRILHKINHMYEKKEEGYSRFNSFLLLNVFMIGTFLLSSILLSLLFITTVKIDALQTVRNVFFALYGASAYLAVNTAHSLFAQGKGIRESVSGTLDMIFSRPIMYLGITFFTIAAFFVLAGAYYALDWAALKTIGTAIQQPAVFFGYAAYNTIIVAALALGILAFNRVYFYTLMLRHARQQKGVKK